MPNYVRFNKLNAASFQYEKRHQTSQPGFQWSDYYDYDLPLNVAKYEHLAIDEPVPFPQLKTDLL